MVTRDEELKALIEEQKADDEGINLIEDRRENVDGRAIFSANLQRLLNESSLPGEHEKIDDELIV